MTELDVQRSLTFYLADNMPGVEVRMVLPRSDDATSGLIRVGCVNIRVKSDFPDDAGGSTKVRTAYAEVDTVSYDGVEASTWREQVRALLEVKSAPAMIVVSDTLTDTGARIVWDGKEATRFTEYRARDNSRDVVRWSTMFKIRYRIAGN